MKVKIKEDLLNVIDDYFEGKEGHRKDLEFLKLCDRIAGKEVELVPVICYNEDYSEAQMDWFEKEDNNYWLPSCCWDVID